MYHVALVWLTPVRKELKIIHFSAFTERILIRVEHEINDLHDEGLLSPSKEMINLLNRMCRRAYDLSVYFLRNERNELIFALDHTGYDPTQKIPSYQHAKILSFSPILKFPCFNK